MCIDMMKMIVVMVIALLLSTGCSKDSTTIVSAPQESCTVTKTPSGARIDCPNGASTVIADGASGLAGANGIDGAQGATGAQGEQGAQGLQGPQGDTGATGATGAKGDQGEQGIAGNDGLNAAPCTLTATANGVQISCPGSDPQIVYNGTNGANGTNGQDGHDGANGVDGSNGSDGQDGTNGTDGANGHDGAPGSTVVPVQFCNAGYVATYPSVFPEYGLRIDGVMYGVYSTHGGFLAKLPPGTYSSNGVGADCTFTINSDYSVTN